ncbi:hypothetical protein FVE67_03405 [Thermosulfurimonas marina]|uniref:Uncharacterized protein n=1 Tax=Thermosulfurimonas marina TaxID=2047767 RepID=A0A6H1WRV6_9BACT|nr:hypothetical protein [Thermosulfurimonas marina]QJA05900.1 hypothetical protein FVE67_03405 [Thermosulfurimonas marina]
MLEKATRKQLVLLQTTSGLYLGLVCFHHGFESLNFVLEKREFFDFEWPAFVAADSGGLRPVLLGLEHIVVQRQNVVWYSTEVPESLALQYRRQLPQPPPEPDRPSPPRPERPSSKDKVVTFPGVKDDDK